MFSPVKLTLKPSFVVTLVFLLPSIFMLVLIAYRDFSYLLSLVLACLSFSISYYYIRIFGSLSHRHAIVEIYSDRKTLKLTEKSGRKYQVTLSDNYFIHPFFCLLSFSASDLITHYSSSGTFSLQHLLPNFLRYKNTRHLLICRYNTNSQNAYRRFRVLMRFK